MRGTMGRFTKEESELIDELYKKATSPDDLTASEVIEREDLFNKGLADSVQKRTEDWWGGVIDEFYKKATTDGIYGYVDQNIIPPLYYSSPIDWGETIRAEEDMRADNPRASWVFEEGVAPNYNKGEELALAHWSYIKGLLNIHLDPDICASRLLEIINFHYVSAFIHGYKHGKEDKE